MFERLGGLVTRRAWWLVGFWVVAVAVLVPLSPGLKTSNGGSSDLTSSYESVRADAAAKAAFRIAEAGPASSWCSDVTAPR